MKQCVLTLLTWDEVQEIYIDSSRVLSELDRGDGTFPEWSSSTKDCFREVLRRLRERYNCPTPIAERYAEVLAAAEQAVGVKLNEGRDSVATTIRSFVAYQLHKEEYSYTDIGRMMGRNHASVMHLVERKENALSVPGAYKAETEMFRKFEEILGALSPSN